MSSVIRALLLLVLLSSAGAALAACDPDGVQDSGSIYRICMPPPAEYNGMLVVWAHGFQDAGTPVGIPEDQLCVDTVCLPDLVNGLLPVLPYASIFDAAFHRARLAVPQCCYLVYAAPCVSPFCRR